jgi:hypothetical protein
MNPADYEFESLIMCYACPVKFFVEDSAANLTGELSAMSCELKQLPSLQS